ncbi:S9 family peptidase [Nakamurella lactea]|uniref:S9 family peptidase n=1 Tax=Nakamurella lactea TaxID=459515 RepID=UPI0009FD698C|nr:prolyl oligopeptidase family serine peptidase [Nakamurella lactea]
MTSPEQHGWSQPRDGRPAPAEERTAAESTAADGTAAESAAATGATSTATSTPHPPAAVPDPLLDDPSAERRWRDRYSASRMSLPVPARDVAGRAAYVSNESGTYELYCWDVTGNLQLQATDRPDGTTLGTLSANGQGLWWFDDDAGDEFGRWMAQPFGAAPGSAGEAIPGVPPGYPAGLEVGQQLVLAGFNDDDGTRIHLARGGTDTEVVYRNENDGSVGALSADEQIWVLVHTEHGDSRYGALRSLRTSDNSTLAELDDSPGKGLSPLDFAPAPGDQRLLVGHERRGRDELLIWDAGTGEVTELAIDLPGDLTGSFFRDGAAVLVLQTEAGRGRLYRYQLDTGELQALPADPGMIDSALARDDGVVWYRGSSAATPVRVRQLHPIPDRDRITYVPTTLLTSPGPQAPSSEPVHDVWVDGPGGRIHALLATPAGGPAPDLAGGSNIPQRAVFLVHGGPDAADEDSFDAERALWLDAGFAVVQVNYRGSSGYGSQWRDAITQRIGHTELADLAAVQDHLISAGIVDQDACALVGASWGGFLTLLGLGAQPTRWRVGVAGVPVADYPAAYQQEMEPLRAYDRALFGGSPQEVPLKYLDASPLTRIDQVTAPVLVLAGANDPRCPIGQIENYLQALSARGADYAVYRYDTGHGSMVVDERIRQAAVQVGFVRAVLRR